MTKIMTRRNRGKGTKPGSVGPPEPLSLRQRVNAGKTTIAEALDEVAGYRPEATIHEWIEKKHTGRRKPRPK